MHRGDFHIHDGETAKIKCFEMLEMEGRSLTLRLSLDSTKGLPFLQIAKAIAIDKEWFS